MIDSNNFLLPHLTLVGGFLGAGKTTLIQRLSTHLGNRSQKTAIVTNDQGGGLVDTAISQQSVSTAVAEITGGCFCCKLDDLVDTIKQLSERSRPDVILAEPVGSCTDLTATVILPLEQIYRLPLTLSPFTVVLDARRALATLGGKPTRRSLTKDVGYIYRKQIEEAQWLVVNKVDILPENELLDLQNRLNEQYPTKRIFTVSARTGQGVEELLNALLATESSTTQVMDVDYERYGIGEALLGWYNATLDITTLQPIDTGTWLLQLAKNITGAMEQKNTEVGHMKMSLKTKDGLIRVHQVLSGVEPEIVGDGADFQGEGTLLINLRAEAEPAVLEKIVQKAVDAAKGVSIVWREKAAFRPGQPTPTHRVAAV